MENNIDIIVVGGGHAGVEAALSAARRNKKVVLITLSKEFVAKMPCNPSIGGPAKGVVVREIDALGGQMGITADKTALQFKMLNTNKGPGVQCLRVQSDKIEYSKMMQEIIEKQENLEVIEDQVLHCLIEDGKMIGVHCKSGRNVFAKITILTTGTYLNSSIMISDNVTSSGPDGEATTNELSESLKAAGIELFRLKTGTPARILTSSIDFSQAELQPGTDAWITFSDTTKEIRPFSEQIPCHLIHTAKKTHEIINENIHLSSMYSGVVTGVGARYCPSIEDKLVRFSDKERHQLFLEPESLSLDTTYLQGFSTSLPIAIQEEMVHSLPGLENAIIKKYAYAIEYDAIIPTQLKNSLELKKIENCFCAGQINGTSGYEEAAAQGLLAGINAVNKLNHVEPLVLRRDEAYIGVMIDDLINKGIQEPYRLLTSRAEFRLLLRHDNADQRLIEKGYQVGLISEERMATYRGKIETIQTIKNYFTERVLSSKDNVDDYFISKNYEKLKDGLRVIDCIKRPNITTKDIAALLNYPVSDDIATQVDIEVKYEGYIEKAKKEASKLQQMDKVVLPEAIDYNEISNLSIEGRSKLIQIRPATLGQASRISGVHPADIAVLAMAIEMQNRRKA